MYAIVRAGGKQYRVTADDVIVVEKLQGERGTQIELGEVLLIGGGTETVVGTPVIEGAAVTATILDQTKSDKILIFKKKRRQNYRRTRGHRQAGTVLRIDAVCPPGAERQAPKPLPAERVVVKEKPAMKKKAPRAEAKPKAASKQTPAPAKAAAQKTSIKKAAPKKKTAPKPPPAKKGASKKDAPKKAMVKRPAMKKITARKTTAKPSKKK